MLGYHPKQVEGLPQCGPGSVDNPKMQLGLSTTATLS